MSATLLICLLMRPLSSFAFLIPNPPPLIPPSISSPRLNRAPYKKGGKDFFLFNYYRLLVVFLSITPHCPLGGGIQRRGARAPLPLLAISGVYLRCYFILCFSTWYKPSVMIFRMISTTTSFQSCFCSSVFIFNHDFNGFITCLQRKPLRGELLFHGGAHQDTTA